MVGKLLQHSGRKWLGDHSHILYMKFAAFTVTSWTSVFRLVNNCLLKPLLHWQQLSLYNLVYIQYVTNLHNYVLSWLFWQQRGWCMYPCDIMLEYALQTLVYTSINRIRSILCSAHFHSWQNPFSSHWPVSVQGSLFKVTSFAGNLDHSSKWWAHFSVPSSVQDTWDYFLGQSAHHFISSKKLYHCD